MLYLHIIWLSEILSRYPTCLIHFLQTMALILLPVALSIRLRRSFVTISLIVKKLPSITCKAQWRLCSIMYCEAKLRPTCNTLGRIPCYNLNRSILYYFLYYQLLLRFLCCHNIYWSYWLFGKWNTLSIREDIGGLLI